MKGVIELIAIRTEGVIVSWVVILLILGSSHRMDVPPAGNIPLALSAMTIRPGREINHQWWST